MSFQHIASWIISIFKPRVEPEIPLLPNPNTIIELEPSQALQVREIFECAVRSENSETGAQECLGCGTATNDGIRHQNNCIVALMLEKLPNPQKEPAVCPKCGTGLDS